LTDAYNVPHVAPMKKRMGIALASWILGGCMGAPADDPAADESAMAVETGDAIELPNKLTCERVVSGHKVIDVLYTRLDAIKRREDLSETPRTVWGTFSQNKERPRPDEVAYSWSGDYYSADISKSLYRYALWTCDSEDRTYSFDAESLITPRGSATTTKDVAGRLHISIRSDGASYDLRCRASYRRQ
jgi:hypothetical protein